MSRRVASLETKDGLLVRVKVAQDLYHAKEGAITFITTEI